MVDRLPFGEGASINRPPLFCGLNYQFWKVRMKIFMESLDKGIWDAIESGPFVPKFEKDGSVIEKPWSQWTDAESKKAKFDCIAKNIIVPSRTRASTSQGQSQRRGQSQHKASPR